LTDFQKYFIVAISSKSAIKLQFLSQLKRFDILWEILTVNVVSYEIWWATFCTTR